MNTLLTSIALVAVLTIVFIFLKQCAKDALNYGVPPYININNI